jgi:hypothetical protein
MVNSLNRDSTVSNEEKPERGKEDSEISMG